MEQSKPAPGSYYKTLELLNEKQKSIYRLAVVAYVYAASLAELQKRVKAFQLEPYRGEHLSAGLSGGTSYRSTRYSLDSAADTQTWASNFGGHFTWTTPHGWERKALDRDGYPWTNLLALDASPALKANHAKVFLLDPDGIILAINPSVEELDRLLQNALGR